MINNRVQLVSHTLDPNQTMYRCMRQDHSAAPIVNAVTPGGTFLNENEAENLIVKHCLECNKIHWGVLEHAHITLGLYGFPRYAILQLRTHRNCTWDVQSMRETGKEIIESGRVIYEMFNKINPLARPFVSDEHLSNLAYDEVLKHFALEFLNVDEHLIVSLAEQLIDYYLRSLKKGFRYENARALIGDNVRCNAHVTLNLRHLLHLGSVRLGGDAQDVTRNIVNRMLNETRKVHPETIAWFYSKQPKKLTLSP